MNNGRVNLFAPESAGGPMGPLKSDAGGSGGLMGPLKSDAGGSGGHMDPLKSGSGEQIPGFQYQDKAEKQFDHDMLRGNWEANSLSISFFSAANVKQIQNTIRKVVFERSQPKGYVIDDQSVDELKMIMRGIFYQYARNLPYDIEGQVDELNKRVIEWSVPHILSAVDHYMYYLKDIDTLPTPISHPVLLSRAGTRSKPLAPFM